MLALAAVALGIPALSVSVPPGGTFVARTATDSCLPVTAQSTSLLGNIRDLATGMEPDFEVAVRDGANLPRLASDSEVQQSVSGPACARAAAAFDSVQHAYYGTPRNPNRTVYLYRYGSLFLAGDPKVTAGEYFPFVVLSPTFEYRSGVMF
jgi:hypothetical protein